MFPAYLFMRLVSLAVIAGMGYGSAIQWGDVLTAVGLDVLAFFLMYSFSILCTVLCGNTFFTVALLFAVLLSLTPVCGFTVPLPTGSIRLFALWMILRCSARWWSAWRQRI